MPERISNFRIADSADGTQLPGETSDERLLELYQKMQERDLNLASLKRTGLIHTPGELVEPATGPLLIDSNFHLIYHPDSRNKSS